MKDFSFQHIRTLLWFHLLNHLRRIVATYIFPILVIGIGSIFAFVYSVNPRDLEYTADEFDFSLKFCHGSTNLRNTPQILNHTVQVKVDDLSYSELDFRTKTFINQRDVPIEVASASRLLCRLATPISTQITFSYPFKKYIDSRYVFTSIDTFSFCVFLFYCICLSELYQDRQRKTDELLWSLGVSNSEQMISWYLAIIAQAMFWSAINFVQLAPQIQSMASSVVLLWFCYSFVFFVTAIFALISSKFVKGCLTFLLAIFQMIFVWLVLFLWSELQDRIPYPSSKVVRMVILLHPIAQAKNMFLLIQSAEFSKLGVTFSTLGSYFNVPQQNFFGNTLETFATMLMLSMFASLLFLVDSESLAESILSRLFKRKANNSQINFREVHEECEMDSKKRAIVEVNRLSMKYPNGFQAITDVSFSIYEGEIVGLLGKNGAGKSTTMNIISGFHSASAGSVKICGIDLKENRKAALSKLSFCPQDDRFFYRLTVLEHLQLMCSLKGAKYDKQRCSRLLDILGLADKAGQKPRNLSGGQKRRVCIAMAYAANSPLIILDEPTSAVDAATRKTLWTFFQTQQKQNPNQAVILCTHFMQEADVLSQRIAVISDGFLRAIGSSSYLKSLFGVGYTFFYARKFASIVKEIVQKYCSIAQFPVKEDQACFQIATEYSSCLPMILDELDSRKIECSFNAATLENVFVSLSTSPAGCDRSSSSCRENDDNDDLREPDKVDTRNSDGFQLKSKFLGVSNKNLNWAYSQLRFAVLVDLLRIFIQNFKFLISFSIAFFLLPQVLMMLCLLDDGFESSGNALKNGNITVSPFTLDSNPKIVLFGEAPDDQVSKIGVILERSKFELLKNVSEEEVMSRYKIHPTEVFNTYPFFLKFNDSHRTFDCLVNSHFSSSALMCITLLIQIYSSNKTVESLNIAADFFYNETGNGDVDMGEGLDENGKNLCRSAIFYYFAPVLYMFLLFFIIRTESRRNEQNLSPFLRANGAFPLFSLAVRVAGLFLLAFAFFAAIVVTTEERHFSLYSKTIPSYGTLGLIVLFCLAFVSFAILIAKVFNSVLVQLSLTLIVYIIYSQIYIRKEIRTTLNDQSKWFYLLTYPGYLIPTGGIGFLNSFDQLSNKDALYSWLAQLTCYLTLVVLIESLIIRVLGNIVAEKLGLNRLISVTQHDTAVEVTKVHHTYYGLNPIRIILRKSCKALQGMNMRVKEGECYALLGVNGAGKSTMFEVLTGGIRLQKGQVCVFGTSVSSNPWGVMKDLGYCSQLDKCPGYLRAKTIVSLFGTLRGLSEDEVIRQMQFMAKVLDVESHLNKFLSGCSGGTKRKVSTMVAFIGFPKLVILDESTTGVDPITRLNFGRLIKAAKSNGSTVIISSHTMEECESAADTICIMTRGKSFCEDTPQALKEEHGKFYSVTIKVSEETDTRSNVHKISMESDVDVGTRSRKAKKDNDVLDSCIQEPGTSQTLLDVAAPPSYHGIPTRTFEETNDIRASPLTDFEFREVFPQAKLQYTFSAGLYKHMFFNIPKETVKLSALFARLDRLKSENALAECIVNTASLEQIFMQIALEDEYGQNANQQSGVSVQT